MSSKPIAPPPIHWRTAIVAAHVQDDVNTICVSAMATSVVGFYAAIGFPILETAKRFFERGHENAIAESKSTWREKQEQFEKLYEAAVSRRPGAPTSSAAASASDAATSPQVLLPFAGTPELRPADVIRINARRVARWGLV